MKFSDSILAKLFGLRTEDGMEDETQEKSDINVQQAMDAEKEKEESTPQIAVNELELPMDHSLNRLYDLREEQAGGLPAPWLRLDGCEDLPLNKVEGELDRLYKKITAESDARVKKAIPKKKEEEPAGTKASDATSELLAEEAELQQEEPEIELDAQPFVFISADKMKAWLMVFPPVGKGREIDRQALEQALKDNGVAFGVDEGLLNKLPGERNRYFRLCAAAKGRPVVQGKDGYIVDYFKRSMQRQVEVDERDRVDYASLNLVQSAEEGALICEAVPPTKAVPGRTVLDKEIPGKDGKAATIPKGQNTIISEDGSKLLASRSGRVEFSGRAFQIKPTMDVENNVDYSTGNINFVGDVHIRGDVLSGFQVKSMGNITVDGVVEAGTVEAGGDLVIAKGIVGDQEAIIRANRNIYSKYLEHGIVHARGNIITDCILHSDVYCDGEVQVTSGRGAIIGGRIRAARGIKANIVGSKSRNNTSIILGGQPCADFDKASLLDSIADMEEEMEKLERQPDSPAKAKRMGKIRLDLSVNRMKLGQFEKEKEKIKEKLEEQGGCRLKCGIIHPGVSLTIGKETLQVTQETSSCNARLINGEIYLI
ncbi:MAG: DUF342 domain-containing protein [Dorea sp.]|jgi:uncharacterized protein (DUF342 family)|nr:DUF342 domain-containing protein [Dorea sp.]